MDRCGTAVTTDGRREGGTFADATGLGVPPRRRVVGAALASLLAVLLPPFPLAHAAPPERSASGDGGDAGPSAGRPRRGIAGRVATAAGRPVRGVVVLVRRHEGAPAPIPELANTTARDGTFFWPLAEGRYRLTFVRNGRTVAVRDVTVGGAAPVTRIDVLLGRRPRP